MEFIDFLRILPWYLLAASSAGIGVAMGGLAIFRTYPEQLRKGRENEGRRVLYQVLPKGAGMILFGVQIALIASMGTQAVWWPGITGVMLFVTGYLLAWKDRTVGGA